MALGSTIPARLNSLNVETNCSQRIQLVLHGANCPSAGDEINSHRAPSCAGILNSDRGSLNKQKVIGGPVNVLSKTSERKVSNFAELSGHNLGNHHLIDGC